MKFIKKRKWIIILTVILIVFVVMFINYPYHYFYLASHKMDYTPLDSEYKTFLSVFGIQETDNIVSVDSYSYNNSETYIYSYRLDLTVNDIYQFFTENVICEGEVYRDIDGNICIEDEDFLYSTNEYTNLVHTITPEGNYVYYKGDIRYERKELFRLQIKDMSSSEKPAADYYSIGFLIDQSEEGQIVISCYDPSSISNQEFLKSIYDDHFYDDFIGLWLLFE